MEKHPNVEYIMLSERKIAKRVKELAEQMDKLYGGRKPVVVCILKGSVVFFADLIRHMKTPLTIDTYITLLVMYMHHLVILCKLCYNIFVFHTYTNILK